MIVKILGGIDLASALAFLMMVFGMEVFYPFLLFCAILLFLKGLFVITGDILSVIDLISSILLFLSIFFSIPTILLWIFSFFLLAKGVASFF